MTTVTEQPAIPQREADERLDLISDLRRMADWLEANPNVPVGTSNSVNVQYSVSAYIRTSPEAARAEVDRVASLLDLKPSGDAAFYRVEHIIGRARYVAVAIDCSAEEDAAVNG